MNLSYSMVDISRVVRFPREKYLRHLVTLLFKFRILDWHNIPTTYYTEVNNNYILKITGKFKVDGII